MIDSIDEEIMKVEEVFAKGKDLIRKGKLKQAARLAKSLRNFWVTSEATRAEILLESYILLTRRKVRRAKENCLESICYLWDDLEGLGLVRCGNPPVSSESQWFDILVKGGEARMGAFTQFSSEHMCRFLVVADDEFEAIRYIDEVGHFYQKDEKELLSFTAVSVEAIDDCERQGVYRCSPFSIDSVPEPFLNDPFASDLFSMSMKRVA